MRRRSLDDDCLCIATPAAPVLAGANGAGIECVGGPTVVVNNLVYCSTAVPSATRFSLRSIENHVHVVSACLICFARGVNDTPKLAALLLTVTLLGVNESVIFIAVVMAAGGLLYARRVAETMSQRITRLDSTQGIAANVITATMVLTASVLSLPVSTTHVAVGAIAGVGAGAATLDTRTLSNVLMSWVATMPVASLIAFFAGRVTS